ncbi:MAG: phosphoenolpyruvate carboxylase [Candidatus Peregrinibacteria bacterium Greene0416_19]|nr:MAG: phosphoenolpyruvate carboxylase [Candidatus Peregrinibacteria bacterium Greene0416_19]
MSWPPITMATQHPDNAGAPWWGGSPFISTQEEIQELITLLQDFPIDEYMWDWEGKYVDESVGEKLFSRAPAFFRRHPLGKDKFLTYRIPAFDGGKMHRMARAFMNVLSLSDLARDVGMPGPPVTEMFLPLTTSARQPLKVRDAFEEIAGYHRSVFHRKKRADRDLMDRFTVTPLVEDVSSLFGIEKIVRPYWGAMWKKHRKPMARGQRVFLARSDPALNSGLVPAVLAVKSALSTVHRVGEDLGFRVYPILGTGSLPFRGSVNPTYLDTFLTQYAGTRTYSIQSAFRYDYPQAQVRSALERIRTEAPRRKLQLVSQPDDRRLRALAGLFFHFWKPTVEALAPLINRVASGVPPRRERLQHIGLFGYSRGVGRVKLPRAIGFTAALYSIGIPPELIATGRGLRSARERGMMDLLRQYYPALEADLTHAGKFFNRENLRMLAKEKRVFRDIENDVRGIEEVLGITLGPAKSHHLIHRNITSTILQRIRSGMGEEMLQRDIVEAAVIRKSLG